MIIKSGHTIGESYGCKVATAKECHSTNGSYTIRDCNGGETTTSESGITNGGDAVRNCDGGKLPTISERRVADRGHRILNAIYIY